MVQPNDVQPVTDLHQFESLLLSAGKTLVVADFYARWCRPCMQIGPKIVKLAKDFEGIVYFLKVDVDVSKDVADKYKVKDLPTFLLFANGEKVGKMSGADESKLRKLIHDYLTKSFSD